MKELKEEDLHKLAPKLRMVANGSEVVNTLRAEQSPSIAVRDARLLHRVPLLRQPGARSAERDEVKAKRGSLKKVSDKVFANVFIHLAGGAHSIPEIVKENARGARPIRKQNLVSATVPLDRLEDILGDPAVIAIEDAERITFIPPMDISLNVTAPPADRAHLSGFPIPDSGGQVIVGIIDVQGFDFAHPDFLDSQGQTRFIRIWDQGGATRPPPARFGYGAELTADHMKAALAAAAEGGLPATTLEPQSQMIPSSHGTHVASIAAGNAGVCPGALIAAVLISLPGEDYDRRKSFYDSTRLAHAVDYLFELGKEYGLPVSINISLGTNGHSHDATSITARWLDYELSMAGRAVCVAAGNAGQEAPTQPGDWGYVLGRIHRGAELPATDSTDDLFWIVVGDGIADLSENELEIWYNPGDHFAVSILPPNGEWIGPLEPGQFIENQELPGGTFVSIYNELYYPANGLNYIAVYLSPFFSDQGVVGVRSGQWTVRLHARDVRDGRFHAWIERDDPRRLGRLGQQEAWSFPSFFSESSFVDRSSVSSLACGNFIFSIANLDEENERIHHTSSQGPTRDGREKPEIAAPGTNIVAANGFSPDQPWVQMTGTSMASPYVTGVIARMLALDPKLTAAQIAGILRRTARPLAGVDFKWCDDAGFGRIDPVACLQEVENLKHREDLTP